MLTLQHFINSAMSYIEIILIALSLSIDTLAVTMSSSVTLRQAAFGKILKVALSFGVIQTLFLLIGWICGASVYNYISSFANFVGFAMLLYIGGQMLIGVFKKGEDCSTNLSGFKAIVLAGVATSIDASAVGVSFAMTKIPMTELYASLGILFLTTFLVALAGIYGGCCIGRRFGRPAQATGGTVLILIGIHILLGW